MATFSAVQLEIDDVEIVVVLLDSSFDARTAEQKRQFHGALETCSARAGLSGNVVAMWRDAAGRTRFLAPAEQHAFFQIVSYAQLEAQVNRRLEFPTPHQE